MPTPYPSNGLFEISRWISERTLAGEPEARLLEGTCERLTGLGVGLQRVVIGCDTLHPVLEGRIFEWRRDREAVRQTDYGRREDPQKQDDKASAPTASKVDERRAAAEKRAALAPLRKKLEAIEARMAKLTEVIGKVDTALADGTAFLKDSAKATELSKMRAGAADTLASLEEEWLMVSGEIEEASA